jgi:hypothetical protein
MCPIVTPTGSVRILRVFAQKDFNDDPNTVTWYVTYSEGVSPPQTEVINPQFNYPAGAGKFSLAFGSCSKK